MCYQMKVIALIQCSFHDKVPKNFRKKISSSNPTQFKLLSSLSTAHLNIKELPLLFFLLNFYQNSTQCRGVCFIPVCQIICDRFQSTTRPPATNSNTAKLRYITMTPSSVWTHDHSVVQKYGIHQDHTPLCDPLLLLSNGVETINKSWEELNMQLPWNLL